MTTWPSTIRNPSHVDVKASKARFRSKFEAGYVQVRGKYTRSRKKFTLNWRDGMTSQEKETLTAFFENNNGSSFDWQNPEDGKTYTVIFSDDEIDFNHEGANIWTTNIDLEEL